VAPAGPADLLVFLLVQTSDFKRVGEKDFQSPRQATVIGSSDDEGGVRGEVNWPRSLF